MCNACGMVCCAWDGFSGCECDCKTAGCWRACEACGLRILPGEGCYNACDREEEHGDHPLEVELACDREEEHGDHPLEVELAGGCLADANAHEGAKGGPPRV